MSVLQIIIAVILIDSIHIDADEMLCPSDNSCVPAVNCRETGDILYPCNENYTHVCCLSSNTIVPGVTGIESRLSLFPSDCGIVSVTDRITGGELAAMGQFPWMAILGYTQRGVNFVQFLCGGSIITKNHILTAAHCISIAPTLKLQVVRLGEHNLETIKDCEGTVCTTYVEIGVERIIMHEGYNNKTLENDIAIIKLQRSINFTEYIRAICLPFDGISDRSIPAGGKLTVSGWGKTDSDSIGGSLKLMYTVVNVWDNLKCNSSVPPKIRPIRESQICANGKKKQDSCKGDSGGPLVNSTVIGQDYRTFQVGIVSFSSASICGNVELPTIYTKVDYYEKWIVDNVE